MASRRLLADKQESLSADSLAIWLRFCDSPLEVKNAKGPNLALAGRRQVSVTTRRWQPLCEMYKISSTTARRYSPCDGLQHLHLVSGRHYLPRHKFWYLQGDTWGLIVQHKKAR